MKLPPDIAAAIIAEAGRLYAAQLREDLADIRLLTLQQAADMLGVSKPTARALAGAVVDLGPQSTRIEFSRIKTLIESRRVLA